MRRGLSAGLGTQARTFQSGDTSPPAFPFSGLSFPSQPGLPRAQFCLSQRPQGQGAVVSAMTGEALGLNPASLYLRFRPNLENPKRQGVGVAKCVVSHVSGNI